ncbi:MAG TPA: hypothetical protein VE646_01655 [Actinomycetota bacterium]|jgi:hypothetical protein|nr:hypothetical protein [Actinomycetota bacterium]
MSRTTEYLKSLDRIGVPDVWERAVQTEPPDRSVPPPISPVRRLGVAALALAVFIAGGSLAWVAFRPTSPAPAAGHGPEGLSARPLALPSIAPGASCPTTGTTRITPGAGFSGSVVAQESAHVYLASSPTVELSARDRQADGWYVVKDVWVIDGTYTGPVLIRGGRIDGAGPLLLGWNPTTPRRDGLLVTAGSPSLQTDPSSGWRSVPMGAYLRSPGCYAYQIDGTDFTSFIVFRARR